MGRQNIPCLPEEQTKHCCTNAFFNWQNEEKKSNARQFKAIHWRKGWDLEHKIPFEGYRLGSTSNCISFINSLVFNTRQLITNWKPFQLTLGTCLVSIYHKGNLTRAFQQTCTANDLLAANSQELTPKHPYSLAFKAHWQTVNLASEIWSAGERHQPAGNRPCSCWCRTGRTGGTGRSGQRGRRHHRPQPAWLWTASLSHSDSGPAETKQSQSGAQKDEELSQHVSLAGTSLTSDARTRSTEVLFQASSLLFLWFSSACKFFAANSTSLVHMRKKNSLLHNHINRMTDTELIHMSVMAHELRILLTCHEWRHWLEWQVVPLKHQ